MNQKNTLLFSFIAPLLMVVFLFCTPGQLSAQQNKNNEEKMVITNQEKVLTLFPMPVTNTVHVHLSLELRAEVDKLEIYNVIGRKLQEQRIISSQTSDVSFTGFRSYPTGIYMVVARDKYGKIVKSAKMIVND